MSTWFSGRRVAENEYSLNSKDLLNCENHYEKLVLAMVSLGKTAFCVLK